MLIKHSAELSEKGSFPKSNSLVNKKNKNKNTDWIKNLVLILIIWKGVNLQLIHWILTLWSFSSSEEKCIVTQSCFLLPSKSFVSHLCRKTTLFIPRRYYLQAKVLIIHKISHYRKNGLCWGEGEEASIVFVLFVNHLWSIFLFSNPALHWSLSTYSSSFHALISPTVNQDTIIMRSVMATFTFLCSRRWKLVSS